MDFSGEDTKTTPFVGMGDSVPVHPTASMLNPSPTTKGKKMKNRFASSLLSCLLLGLVLVPLSNAQARRGYSPVDIEVVGDRGQELRQFPLSDSRGNNKFRAYLEARRGEHYAIRVSNNSSRRVGVVIAVDGRNIISGKKSDLAPSERMYVLRPQESAEYEGWRTGRNRVNRFYFTDSEDSYAEAFHDRSAMGVIAVATYGEKVREVRPELRGRSMRRPGAAQSKDQAGTGFGEEKWSPTTRVEFTPEKRPLFKHFIKYEWRKTLCRKGVIECDRPRRGNRFWPQEDEGYAPYPPGYRESWRRNNPWWMSD